MPLTVGGGVRTVDDIRKLLTCGADKVVDQHRGGDRRAFVKEAAEKFGDQCIVVAIDAKKVSKPGETDRWEIFTHGGRNPTGLDAVDYAREVVSLGAGEILLTSMDRDGTKSGFDIALTRAVADAVPVPVIASGGVGKLDHLVAGIRDGHATAVLAASIFHFGEFTVRAGQGATWRRPACRCGSIRRTAAFGLCDGARPASKDAAGSRASSMRAAPGTATACAQRSACSSRSLPQNNSPSAVMKLGAPKMPSCCASSVCARSRALLSSDCAAASAALGVDAKPRQDRGERRRRRRSGRRRANCARKTATQKSSPQPCVSPNSATRAASRLFCGNGSGRRNGRPRSGAQPLQVAPHVAALGRVEIERRGVPALRLEDRAEQERPEAHVTPALAASGRMRRAAEIGIGRGEIEPEVEDGLRPWRDASAAAAAAASRQ